MIMCQGKRHSALLRINPSGRQLVLIWGLDTACFWLLDAGLPERDEVYLSLGGGKCAYYSKENPRDDGHHNGYQQFAAVG